MPPAIPCGAAGGTVASAAARCDPARRILWARGLRDFGDGLVAVVLPAYLVALGYGAAEVGAVATIALLGSALMTLGVGVAGARADPRLLLLLAAALMALTGLGFAGATGLAALATMALVGTINPSAGSVSIFVPLEQAMLTHASPDARRTAVFARYSLVGALAAAAGALTAAGPEALAAAGGVPRLTALQSTFLLYAALGLCCLLAYRPIPSLPAGERRTTLAPLGPSRGIVLRLAALFCVDSFAGGLAVQSLLALWLFERFGLSLTEAGLFFFWSGVLSAFSFPVAAWLAGRIGLVNTMVFTHIPSSLALIAAALAPTVELALGLLLLRSALSQMDVPTRSSYVMAVVTPAERTAAASFTAVPRSLAAAASPALAGAVFAAGHQELPLIACGVLKILYDIALLAAFRHRKPPEEQ
ncbi:MFS transporter [Siccirubricoccus sp. KC 17139]|uniref:MFS transporter n=1 Tax=Siccirubricoccus soli TaxID=2899147 RepID=A0ABT1DBG9_9PROT|nr:MFS transporter [Siccirubricoccus soli]MCO6419239.1 MFS transporter [Siccirubricoccus soli]MCP2685374.1 MFS transporter [Siccirubricoccus soli]